MSVRVRVCVCLLFFHLFRLHFTQEYHTSVSLMAVDKSNCNLHLSQDKYQARIFQFVFRAHQFYHHTIRGHSYWFWLFDSFQLIFRDGSFNIVSVNSFYLHIVCAGTVFFLLSLSFAIPPHWTLDNWHGNTGHRDSERLIILMVLWMFARNFFFFLSHFQ